MAIAERVKEVAEQQQNRLASEPRFAELQAFYERMKREGIAIRKEYDLPPLDTIGRSLFSSLITRTRR